MAMALQGGRAEEEVRKGTFASTEGPFLYRFKAKRLTWKKRHYNEVLVMADRRKLMETLQEVIDSPDKEFPRPFWEVLSKRCIKSMHLLEPLELAILARAFDLHQPDLHKSMDIFQPLATQVRSSCSFVPGMAVIALTQILPRRLRSTKEELADLMRFFSRRAADCMWEIPLDFAVRLLQELSASGVNDAALCRRVSQKLQARLRQDALAGLPQNLLGLPGRAAAAMADQDFRDLELFRCLVDAAARGLEGPDVVEAQNSARAVLKGVAWLKLELPEAQALEEALNEAQDPVVRRVCPSQVVHRQIWVPPFGAVALIFAAESVAAAKQGKLICRKTVGNRALKACSGVATACVCTVALAQLCGSPTLMRTIVMFAAAYSMVLNPGADYFPPAGALCALFVEKAVVVGKPSLLPGFEYALFPCAVGVGLLLLFSRLIAFVLARAHWALLPSRDAQDREPLLSKA
ncbi:eryA [Symbiodinium natans]|uniref:EryA protein n=1 Tax=Symbiodinium natans TaxID=878477 RepID=A0A812RS31_9DINO|nr:eryA [Symbiodinium natans]